MTTTQTNATDLAGFMRGTVGFDHVAKLMERAIANGAQARSYPPYNIERLEDDRYRVTLAVAGFDLEDLTIEQEMNKLLISGSRKDADPTRTFLHQGIAERSFDREFYLADHVKVVGASLDLGLLAVDLEKEVPEEKKPRRVEIQTRTN